MGAIQGSRRQGGGEDRDASGGGGQGINLLASLLEALTQAASAQSSAASGATSGAAAAGTSTTTGATGTTATNATTGTPPAGGSAATTGTPGSILVQDLQTFLHDLFRALRHVSRSDDDGGRARPLSPAATGGASTTVPVGAGAYRPHGIISALQTLIQDLSNGPAAGNTNAISSTRFATLNAAFEKLIADLSGTPAPVAGTTSDIGTSTTASGTSPDGSTQGASAAGSTPSTAALQSFLINFAQDLQNYGTHSLRTLGTSVNTTA